MADEVMMIDSEQGIAKNEEMSFSERTNDDREPFLAIRDAHTGETYFELGGKAVSEQ